MDECPLTHLERLQDTLFFVWESVCFLKIPCVRKIIQTDSEKVWEGGYHSVDSVYLCVVGLHTVLVFPFSYLMGYFHVNQAENAVSGRTFKSAAVEFQIHF